MDLYQNYSTTDFHRKAQAVASNIHKISQNGKGSNFLGAKFANGLVYKSFVYFVCFSSVLNEPDAPANELWRP